MKHSNIFKLAIGDYVIVPFVRSSYLDPKNNIGWVAYNVIVQVSKINDITFCFEFNNDIHYELKDNVKKTKLRQNIFEEKDKIEYANIKWLDLPNIGGIEKPEKKIKNIVIQQQLSLF